MQEAGGYRLVERLGGGASGTVWRAERVGLVGSPPAPPVALKIISEASSESATEQLRREAAVLAELDHPHIVRLLGVVDHEGAPALAMGLARGGSLARLLAASGRLSPGQAVAILAPVADALASAHRRGLVHGDVKPSNVLLTSDGEPLLADFGAAGRWGHQGRAHRGSRLTDEQPLVGTEPYLDPALLAGGAPEPSSDLYALAVTGHELLTGHLPGRDGGRRLHGDRSVPPALAGVLEAALNPAPADQPADLGRFAAELRAAVPVDSIVVPGPSLTGLGSLDDEEEDIGGHERPGGTGAATDDHHRTRLFGPRPPEPPMPAKRGGWRASVGALLVLAVVVTAVTLWGGRHRSHGATATRARARVQPAAPPCPTFPAVGSGVGEAQLRADINGDGCPVPVAWDGQVMQVRLRATDVRPARFRFDRRGQLLLGDWNCDGRATPALYLPTTGEVVYYNRLADRVEEQGVEEQGVDERGVAAAPGGKARTVRDQDGCDDVQVSPAPS